MSREVERFKPEVRKATKEDCDLLAKVLRQADREEIAHGSGLPPRFALRYSLQISDFAYSVWLGDELVMIFGAGGVKGYGCPWMMASDALLKVKREFVKECRHYVRSMLEMYGYLENRVWAGNKVHIYWLHWLGFTIEAEEPYGINGEPFHRFYMKR